MTATTVRPDQAIALGSYVCWSRMQAEAGQRLESIVDRKEQERRAGSGVFFWGVGNAPPLIAGTLARAGLPVRVVFSIMKSRPKLVDVRPARTVVWRRFIDANGVERDLPAHALVTSRADGEAGPKRVHYALMCYSQDPLELRVGGSPFDPTAFRNAGGTGAPVGNSQVTALVKQVAPEGAAGGYEVNLSAWLTGSYWVRLTAPVEITPLKKELMEQLAIAGESEWMPLVAKIRDGPIAMPEPGTQARLL